MDVCITPCRLSGSVSAVASKSQAHRLLICTALAEGTTEISLPSSNEDIEVTQSCLRALGARISGEGGLIRVTPVDRPAMNPVLDCGQSGSTLRFLLPVAAALGCGARFEGRGRLPLRPMGPLVEQLRAHGCTLDADLLPMQIAGRLQPGTFSLPGDVSSQYVSGLLFALPLLGGDSRIELSSPLESGGYVEMTLRALRQFGVQADAVPGGYHVPGGQRYRSSGSAAVEGDWSGAAFMLVAGALGGPAGVQGLSWDSPQGDRAICGLLSEAGAEVSCEQDTVWVRRGQPMPFRADMSQIPDLFPALAVLACAAQGDSKLYHAARLRLKESDRIAATAAMLRALGAAVTEADDSLTIHGTGSLEGGEAESCGDHRIAMAAASASVLCRRDVVIRGAHEAQKSYPGFYSDFEQLGGSVCVL